MTDGHLRFKDKREADAEAWEAKMELDRGFAYVNFLEDSMAQVITWHEIIECNTEEKRIGLISRLQDALHTEFVDMECGL
jgi:hypothetical protein